ncbi:MAG: globin family protein [bacterium]|nr:globin family protein [bacterium]
MTADQIALVKSTFAAVAPNAPAVARLFYGRLFEIAPHYRALFKADMDEQGKKLMQILAVAVNSLENLPAIVPAVQALGQRHVGYGVQAADYQTVGAALLWTLEQGLGEGFTPEVKAAWAATYTLLADTAVSGAHQTA